MWTSRFELWKMRTHVPLCQVWMKLQFAIYLLLLMIVQLYLLPPPLPPVSNSSGSFTQCQPLCASPCVPAVVPYYCTFQGTMSMHMLTCFSCFWLFAIPWTVAHQAPLSIGFSIGFPCPTPGDLPDPGIEPRSLTSFALAGQVLFH